MKTETAILYCANQDGFSTASVSVSRR